MSSKLSNLENLAIGVSAGTIEVSILQPMLYFKNATQQRLPLSLNPKIVYRGLSMSIVNMSVLAGLQFPLTGAVKKLVTGGEERELSMTEMILSGFAGGAISGVACAPMELVVIQQQRFGGTLLGTPTRIANAAGGSTLFRGLLTSMGREGCFTAGYLGIGPALTDKLQKDHGLSSGMAKVGGAVAGGVIAATLSHPLDTIKTCMQGDIEKESYTSLSGTASKLFAEGGAGRFFTGWGWRTGRMICAVFIMGQCKEILSPLFFPHHFT